MNETNSIVIFLVFHGEWQQHHRHHPRRRNHHHQQQQQQLKQHTDQYLLGFSRFTCFIWDLFSFKSDFFVHIRATWRVTLTHFTHRENQTGNCENETMYKAIYINYFWKLYRTTIIHTLCLGKFKLDFCWFVIESNWRLLFDNIQSWPLRHFDLYNQVVEIENGWSIMINADHLYSSWMVITLR